MNTSLPECITSYFDLSNGAHPAGIVECFTSDAVVLDERQRHQGHHEIRDWLVNARQKFDFSVEPSDASRDGERIAVAARVVGNFPGNPVELQHLFQLDAGKIQALEIR